MKKVAFLWTVTAICGIIFCGCVIGYNRNNNMDILPHKEYATKRRPMILDKRLIEGENEVVFAIEPEERAKYIPAVTWRKYETQVLSEPCSFALVKASGGINEYDVETILTGQAVELPMRAGEYFLLKIDAPYWLSEIEVSVDGEVSVVVMGDEYKSKCLESSVIEEAPDAVMREEYIFTELLQPPYERLTFSASSVAILDRPMLCKYLLVKAKEDAGAVLHSISAKGKPTLIPQILRDLGESPIVVDAADPSNPISIYRKPIRKIHYQLAEKLLEGTESLSDHQKMMVFMDYIADFHIGTTPKESILEEYVGACGRYSNLLATLAYTQGMPARLLSLANYPEEAGHAVCEVFYDGAWHLYDPTFGAYYTTSAPDEAAQPVVLGYEELSQGLGNVPDVTCVVTSPHRLVHEKLSYGFLGPRIYEKANPKGVIGPEFPMVYPLSLQAAPNGSTVLTEKDFSNEYQGIQYIGAAAINNMHEWTLGNLELDREYEFSIVGKFVGGDRMVPFQAKASSENVLITEGEEHVFDTEDKSTLEWKIRFIPEVDEAKIMLTHDYRGPELCYIWLSGFELRCAD